ncbi:MULTISPECIES: type I polyketide synthase [unclassified Nodularia (in: cyanobacteria)]|uniref:type I polyketide synthase n=1 Tax=unclassified Nodularia (in: cyanobacteria) TaxID=2656917 RepID=UPI00187F22B4|nr:MULTISPECIES: type I polyketide synthase [unclassified Nodularia (in: cyanobacteria)]MBE9201696.1 SDR family NAD(P)-dependent oxidoreductase [Nodularia sp. LEGE 06071]MCC2691276.1 SDR family NAD(P)-dependent oxidoreductase [Nodularia sp. LEGE 04288]
MEQQTNGLEIAIIGMAGRFPGSNNTQIFWENLINGKELVSAFTHSDSSANGSIKAGGVLSDIDLFDADFFGFNPREAETMDPQHRLFLECAWEALEDAGCNSETESRPIGVYAGVGMGTYLLNNLSLHPDLMASQSFLQTLVGADKDYLSTRVSYKLNLRGPSISIGTACSSSLVAVHLACQSLLSGECDMALAAGVAVKVPQSEATLFPEEIGATDGHCKAFDAKANGTVGGNGLGVVVLKRLEDAVAEGDHIYAVIKGSAINNDGAVKVGYTAPSQEGQAKVIRTAQIMAEVAPETISYLETHGTGTAMGDPIEVKAMTEAFQSSTNKKGYCAIGSVKTNIGHLDAAAGIAGMIKTALALKYQKLPPSLNFSEPNPNIDFENSPFYVNTKLTDWETNGTPRRAGVSAFGFGGTNVHLILEEAPRKQLSVNSQQLSARKYQLLVVSAKTSSALETATRNLVNHLKQHPEVNLADVAYTLQVGRRVFSHRQMVVVEDIKDAIVALESPQKSFSTNKSPVVFMFPGQGAQYADMARELYESESIFQEECDRCCQLLQPHLQLDLRHLLYPSPEQKEEATEKLNQTAITQPALFVIEYSLAKLWMSWGIVPEAFIGHSIGEYVAATLAGVFSLEDALSLVALRGKLIQQCPTGDMLSVYLSTEALSAKLNPELTISVRNSPSLNVVSGSVEAIKKLEIQLLTEDIKCRRLHTSHAFHSPMMASAIAPLKQAISQLKLNPPQVPFISNVTGTWITPEASVDPNYWTQQLQQPVRFSEGITELLKDARRIFLEVGPGQTLSSITRQQATDRTILNSLRHPQEDNSDLALLLNTLGRLWLVGVEIDWTKFHIHHQRDRLSLPTYPFERQRYWIDPPEQKDHSPLGSPNKKPDIAEWFYVPSWKRSMTPFHQVIDLNNHQCWLVFMDGANLGSVMGRRLEESGATVIRVAMGEEFSRVSENIYTINPSDRQDYDRLIREVLKLGQIPLIAHLWTVSCDLSFAESQVLGFDSLLYLAQAIATQNFTDPLHLGVVSSNIHNVTGNETISPEKATILGTCQVIPQEYANITCNHIDLAGANFSYSEFIDRLITEIASKSTDTVVAYRDNSRWLPTYESVRLAENQDIAPLKEEGVYLITGGWGGIGFTIAKYLAETVRAKLVLVSRSIPSKATWTNANHDEATTAKIHQILELEQLGAEILSLSADVSDAVQMATVAQSVERVFGKINGIFHTAGIPGSGIIQLKTPEMVAQVMAAKVKGTLVIKQIFKDVPLDFLVLFSSISSTLGGVGQVDYSAANVFLDSFARSPDAQKNWLTTAINWDIWQQVGMGANMINLPDAFKQKRLETLKAGITNNEGLDALKRVLQSGLDRIIVSTKDWQGVLSRRDEIVLDEFDPVQSVTGLPTSASSYDAPTNHIEQGIAQVWQEQLGIELIGIHDNFFELGGHSLLAMKVISRLRGIFAVDLSLRNLLETPTIAQIADAIANAGNPQPEAELHNVLTAIENLSAEELQELLGTSKK